MEESRASAATDETDSACSVGEADHGGRPCPVCNQPLYSRHCKYVCPEHGVVYDCSDTFY
jgi:hypothetical protein